MSKSKTCEKVLLVSFDIEAYDNCTVLRYEETNKITLSSKIKKGSGKGKYRHVSFYKSENSINNLEWK